MSRPLNKANRSDFRLVMRWVSGSLKRSELAEMFAVHGSNLNTKIGSILASAIQQGWLTESK